MLINIAGLGILDLLTSANNKILSSLCASSKLIGSLSGASVFPTSDKLLTLRKECMTEKNTGWRQRRQTQGISWWPWSIWTPSHHTLQKHRFLDDRTGYYDKRYSICGHGISWFLCISYDVTPPNLKKITTVALSTSPYVTHLDAVTEAMLSRITKKCVMSSYIFLLEPSPLTTYTENPSSTRAASDQRRRYIRGGADWIQEVTLSFEDCGKSRLTP